MEVSVKWLYDRIDGHEPALTFRGRKFGNCVVLDRPIRVFTVPVRDLDKMRVVEHHGKPYNAKVLAKDYLSKEKSHGITQAAKRLCQAVLDGTHLPEEEIDARPSENFVPGLDEEPLSKRKRKSIQEVKDEITRRRENGDEPKPKKERAPTTSDGPKRGTILATICEELKIEPKDARKRLRAAGMSAPYDDAEKIRAVLTK